MRSLEFFVRGDVAEHLFDQGVLRKVVSSRIVGFLGDIDDLEDTVDDQGRKPLGTLLPKLAEWALVVHAHV